MLCSQSNVLGVCEPMQDGGSGRLFRGTYCALVRPGRFIKSDDGVVLPFIFPQMSVSLDLIEEALSLFMGKGLIICLIAVGFSIAAFRGISWH